MKFYLAGKYDKRETLFWIAEDLITNGHQVQAEWLDGTHSDRSEEAKFRYAITDFQDIDACDTLVMFNLPTEAPEMSPGRHVELGYALAHGKPCIVVGAGDCVFYTLAVKRFTTINEFLNAFLDNEEN
jgi:nucleoside 2-deoxyribosyltransferase